MAAPAGRHRSRSVAPSTVPRICVHTHVDLLVARGQVGPTSIRSLLDHLLNFVILFFVLNSSKLSMLRGHVKGTALGSNPHRDAIASVIRVPSINNGRPIDLRKNAFNQRSLQRTSISYDRGGILIHRFLAEISTNLKIASHLPAAPKCKILSSRYVTTSSSPVAVEASTPAFNIEANDW